VAIADAKASVVTLFISVVTHFLPMVSVHHLDAEVGRVFKSSKSCQSICRHRHGLRYCLRMTKSSARDRLEQALARIADPAGEGCRACLTVYTHAARAAADAADARAKLGISLGPLDGAIVSIKDLFDVAGEVTRAGSRILAEEGTPAAVDALVVRRLRGAAPSSSPRPI
jgi:Asp-tRNA(Asn)/Glu-tRNA(Gln) amidotransferase A subunit family amidase